MQRKFTFKKKKKKKIFVGVFTALLRSCYVEMKVGSVRKKGAFFFFFALHRFPCNSASLLDDGWQLLDSLCSPGVGCSVFEKGVFENLLWVGGMIFVRSATFLEKEKKYLLGTH